MKAKSSSQKEIDELRLELEETEKCWKNNEKSLNMEIDNLKKQLSEVKQTERERILKIIDEYTNRWEARFGIENLDMRKLKSQINNEDKNVKE